MRFTKIPLIATLMAVALSLLIVLPALAVNNERTDGRLNQGSIEIGVFDNIVDAQMGKFVDGEQDNQAGDDIYIPKATTITRDLGQNEDQHTSGTSDRLTSGTPASSPQDTNFRSTLYVSNNVSGYNTVLVNYTSPAAATATTTCKLDSEKQPHEGPDRGRRPCGTTAPATASRCSSWKPQTPTAPANPRAFFKVVHKDIKPYVGPGDDGNLGTDDDLPAVAYDERGGPTWCADQTADVDHDNDSNTTAVARETPATNAVNNPISYARGRHQRPQATTQEIATIFASHGDRLTVTVGNDQDRPDRRRRGA